MTTESMTATSGWLNGAGTTGLDAQQQATSNCMQSYYNLGPYWSWTEPRRIKLTMEEVDVLRKAAKADEKLKAVLAKFTDTIQVEVQFK